MKNSFQEFLVTFVRSKAPSLDRDYGWELPRNLFPGFAQQEGDSLATSTRQLKRFLAGIWHTEPPRRSEIAHWFVGSWGGIRRNKPLKLERYVSTPPEELAASHLQGISTWSKILCVQNPELYPIFDARVAAALNALQILSRTREVRLFPSLPSRNDAIKQFNGWLRRPAFKVAAIDKSGAYAEYRALVQAVCSVTALQADTVEMVLFTHAEELARKAVSVAHSNRLG